MHVCVKYEASRSKGVDAIDIQEKKYGYQTENIDFCDLLIDTLLCLPQCLRTTLSEKLTS